MAVFKINKTKDYTIMSNTHLKEKEMSLKAKGLLSEMLSLPSDWDYSINGLVAINKENETSIKTTLKELQKFGYLKITKQMPNQTKTGRIEYIYDIYEKPIIQVTEKQGVENLPLEIQGVDFQGQLNTNISNTKNKKINNKTTKHRYGEYQNVLLTDKELETLKADYINYNELIKFLDEYIEMKGYKAKSHYLAIQKWVVRAVEEDKARAKPNNSNKWSKNTGNDDLNQQLLNLYGG